MKKNSLVLASLMLAFVLTSFFVYQKQDKPYPIDEILAKTTNDQLPMSIVLYDMDVKNQDNSQTSTKYFQRYKVITNMDDPNKSKTVITDWQEVSEKDFAKNYDNLDMEIASKIMDNTTLKISKVPAPPGYANFVGNEKYGQWKVHNDGTSFWAFHGKYTFMRSMFNMATYPVHRNIYSNYRRDYHNRSAYYGDLDTRRRYGTGSRFSRNISRSGYYTSKRSMRVRTAYADTHYERHYRSGNRSGYSSRYRGGNYGK